MKRYLTFLVAGTCLLAASLSPARAQTAAEPVKLTGDLVLNAPNGLCWDDGVLYFSDINIDEPGKSRTFRLGADGAVETLTAGDNVIATRALADGRFVRAKLEGHCLVETDADGSNPLVLADGWNGRPFEGPIDIAVDGAGGLYFTDTVYYYRGINYIEMRSSVFHRAPDGTLARIIDSVVCPWAVALSPDGSVLYLAFIGGDDAGTKLFSYEILPDATLSPSRQFGMLELSSQNVVLDETWRTTTCKPSNPASSGASGLAVDRNGNVYVATDQGLGVQVFGPGGAKIGTLAPGLAANDCCIGGVDGKKLFLAAPDGIYALDLPDWNAAASAK